MRGDITLKKHPQSLVDRAASDQDAGAPVAQVDAVTQEMIKAGKDCLRDLPGGGCDPAYLVESVYLAMEYQRLDSLGQLRRLVG